MCVVEISITGVSQALVPEKVLGTRVKLVKAKLLNWAGRWEMRGSKKGIDLVVGCGGKRRCW